MMVRLNVPSYERSACWVKNSADDILKKFSYFSQKTSFGIPCTLSPLHEMPKPIFWELLAQRVVMVNIENTLVTHLLYTSL